MRGNPATRMFWLRSASLRLACTVSEMTSERTLGPYCCATILSGTLPGRKPGTFLQIEEEGCLSLPGFEATVVRPTRAVVKGLDRDGTEHQREGTGLLARAFQHEMDHLDGKLFIDHLRGIKRDVIVRKIKKLTRAGNW